MPWDDTDNARLTEIADALNPCRLDFIPSPLERIANALERIADTLEQKPAAKPKAAEPVQAVPLTGQELLDKVKDLGDVSKSALVRACGYVTIKKDGGDRLNFTSFYEALLEAKGVDLEELKQQAS